MIVLKIADLRKSYNGKMVLDGLNFEIPKGEALSIIGSNGAGKSTLIKKVHLYLNSILLF